jgi:hypothetical protein
MSLADCNMKLIIVFVTLIYVIKFLILFIQNIKIFHFIRIIIIIFKNSIKFFLIFFFRIVYDFFFDLFDLSLLIFHFNLKLFKSFRRYLKLFLNLLMRQEFLISFHINIKNQSKYFYKLITKNQRIFSNLQSLISKSTYYFC